MRRLGSKLTFFIVFVSPFFYLSPIYSNSNQKPISKTQIQKLKESLGTLQSSLSKIHASNPKEKRQLMTEHFKKMKTVLGQLDKVYGKIGMKGDPKKRNLKQVSHAEVKKVEGQLIDQMGTYHMLLRSMLSVVESHYHECFVRKK